MGTVKVRLRYSDTDQLGIGNTEDTSRKESAVGSGDYSESNKVGLKTE